MIKLDLLVLFSCIATEEGYFDPEADPALNNNPGDLDYAGQLGAVQNGRWAKFDKPERGIVAGLRQLCADIQRGWNLTQVIDSWAPEEDGNDPNSYLQQTLRRYTSATKDVIDPTVPLWNYLPIEHIP